MTEILTSQGSPMLSQGKYKIEYTKTGILFTFQVEGKEYSFLISDFETLKQLQVIIDTFINQHR